MLVVGVSALLVVTCLRRGDVTEPVAPGVAPDEATAAVKPTAPELAHVDIRGRRLLVVKATEEAVQTPTQPLPPLGFMSWERPLYGRTELLSSGAQELALAIVAAEPRLWMNDRHHTGGGSGGMHRWIRR